MNKGTRRSVAASLGIVTAAVVTAALAAPGAATTPTSDLSVSAGFRKGVSVKGIQEHLNAFKAHADANGGSRVAGGAGNNASIDYVYAKAQAAGLQVTKQPFEFDFNADITPPELEKLSPNPQTYIAGADFASMSYSGSGNVTGAVSAVDLGSTNSGCEAADFAGFQAGSIALIKRGSCTFAIKALNAKAAGAVAVVIFNNGPGLINGTLGGLADHLPVLGATPEIGFDWSNGIGNGPTGATARVEVNRVVERRTTYNVIADTPGGDPHNVVLVGAHLDSVAAGPGINDNGTGSAGILEIAETYMAQKRTPQNKLRFVWWGAEEFSLLGSDYYVDHASAETLDDIALNLNFDMIGSPNYARFVYDGDNSAFPVGPGAAEGPDGSGQIESVFHTYFDAVGLSSDETPFSGRSDYGPFIAVGIPAGGLFTGAEGIKTAAQEAAFGGVAGTAYDVCYHRACDTIDNVNVKGLDEMSDAAAHAVLTFSRQDFAKHPLVNAEAAATGDLAGGGEGGGLHDEHDHDLLAE